MLNLTRILCGLEQSADNLRYGRGHGAASSAGSRRPVVVWNITRRCNLYCRHCYSESAPANYPGELNFDECLALLDDLADFGVPAVLLSGGEPLAHPRFLDLVATARQRGLRLTLSTNGTLLTATMARRLHEHGLSYVGISLDGIGAAHDAFRGRKGAFDGAVNAFAHCRAVGQKTGLRLTLTKHTVEHLDAILDFVEEKDIRRVCFYHLVPTGRGASLEGLDPETTRSALDRIFARVERWAAAGAPREVLTVDQPADAAYALLYLRGAGANGRLHAAEELLKWNGGGLHGSGVGLGNIDARGDIHPDQFWQDYTLGNVRQKPFSRIWSEDGDDLLVKLRNKRKYLPAQCRECAFCDVCGGGFRARAWHATGDPWAADPGCYLTPAERAMG